MISRREILHIKMMVDNMPIKPPEIKPIIANYLIKRARVFDLDLNIIEKDILSIGFHLREVTFNESKEYGRENSRSAATYFPKEMAIRMYVDHMHDMTPQELHQTLAHELNHILNRWVEQVEGKYYSEGNKWNTHNSKKNEDYYSFEELIVERASSLTIFSDVERNNLFLSNNYRGYFESGPCLEMAIAAFGIGEYEFLKNGIKSKEVLKKYIADNTPFSIDEIDNTFNSFEHFYNWFHNAQYGSYNPAQESNNLRREDIASGMIGMMNVSEGHIQDEIEKRDILADPYAIEMLAIRQNQLRVAFETCFNNSLWNYGVIPDSNIRVFEMTISSLKETSKRIHYLQQIMHNRKKIEQITGDEFKNVIEAFKKGDLQLAYSILATCDKRLDYKRIEEISNSKEKEKAIIKDLSIYGIRPIREDYILSFDPKVADIYFNKNKPPKMPLSQRIADIMSEVKLFSLFNKKRAELGYKNNLSDLPILKVLKNRTQKFPEFPITDSYHNQLAFNFSRYIKLDNMTPEQKNKYVVERMNEIEFQTPELRKAFFTVISERVANYNTPVIQLEGEIALLLSRFDAIRFTTDPPKNTIDKDKMIYLDGDTLLINQNRVAEANDPEALYQELSGMINCLMDTSHNDYLLDGKRSIVHNGYYEYMNGLFGKYEYVKYHQNSMARITPVEDKLFYIPEILSRILDGKSKYHLFDFINIARKGEKHLNNNTYDPYYSVNLLKSETFIEGVDLLYKTLHSDQLSEEEQSNRLIDGCNLLFDATEMYTNYTIANYINGKTKSLDNFFDIQGILANNVKLLAEDCKSDSPFAQYAKRIYDKIIDKNQGVLYIDRLLEKDNTKDNVDKAIFSILTGGFSNGTFYRPFNLNVSKDTIINDDRITWEVCIVALTEDYSVSFINKLKQMPIEELQSTAETLLSENGITLPNGQELSDRIKKIYKKEPEKDNPPDNRDDNNGFESIPQSLFKSVICNISEETFNIDGKGEAHHPTKNISTTDIKEGSSEQRIASDSIREDEEQF